jgi:HEAT repeats
VTNPQNAVAEPDASSVAELLQLVEKGLRAIQLYLPNNPMYSQSLDNLRKGFAKVWAEMGDVTLRVKGSSGFDWQGIEIASSEDKNDLLAWTLYKDGIRTLTFMPGVEEDEIVRFLGVVNRVRSLATDAEDDLLTLLWEQEFFHIQYMYVELGTDDMPSLQSSANFGTPPAPESVNQTVQEEVQDESAKETALAIASMEDFDSTLYFLDDAEIRHFKEELEREYQQDLRSNVLAMLFDILELHEYDNARGRVVEILEHLLPHFLGAGDFTAVAVVLSESRTVLERLSGLEPKLRQVLEQLPDRLSQPETLSQILQALDEALVHPTEEALGELFKSMKPEAMDTILAWLPRLHTDTVRDLLERAVDPIAQYHPEAVGRALKSEDRAVILGALRLVERHNLQTLVGQLAPLVGHTDVSVRMSLVDALAAVGTPVAMQSLRRLVADGDRDVRIASVKALTEKGHRQAFEEIDAQVQEKVLKSTDLGEKRVFFEAYGLLGGDKSVEPLSTLLVNKGLLKRKWDPETRACAAAALGKAGTASAKAVLEGVRADKDPLVRNAVLKALREIRIP